MSKTKPRGFDDFSAPESDDSDEPAELKLDNDDWVTGTVQDLDDDAGQYGSTVLTLLVENCSLDDVNPDDVRSLWTTYDLEQQVNNLRVRAGDDVAIKRTDDREFTDDDGNEKTMHQWELRVA